MNPIQIQQGWRIENYEIASLGKTISEKLVRESFSQHQERWEKKDITFPEGTESVNALSNKVGFCFYLEVLVSRVYLE